MMGTLAKVAGFAIVLLAMFCLLGKMSAMEARVDHLEHVLRYARTAP